MGRALRRLRTMGRMLMGSSVGVDLLRFGRSRLI